MLLEFDADQRLWQETVRDAVAKQCPPSLVRSVAEDGVDPTPLWKVYIDQGWTELTDPENAVELAIVLEELGRATDPTPFLATMTQFAPLAGDRFDAQQAGTAIYGGVTARRDAEGWVLDGTAHHVLDGDRAEKLAVVTEAGVFPGVVCRPFADLCGEENKDFNEVFFTDARVPVENLVGPLNGGWGVANGSLGHERTMMWLGFVDRIDNLIADFRPRGALERDQYASMIMDYQALRAMGSAALARAARGEMDTASVSVLKLFGSEAEMRAADTALTASGADGLIHPSTTGPYAHMNLDHYFASWFERYARSFSGTIAGGTSEIQRNIIATQVLGLPRR